MFDFHSLSVIFLRLMPVGACVNTLFLCIAVQESAVARGSRSHGTTGVHAPLDVRLGCVRVLHVMNNSAVSLHA